MVFGASMPPLLYRSLISQENGTLADRCVCRMYTPHRGELGCLESGGDFIRKYMLSEREYLKDGTCCKLQHVIIKCLIDSTCLCLLWGGKGCVVYSLVSVPYWRCKLTWRISSTFKRLFMNISHGVKYAAL